MQHADLADLRTISKVHLMARAFTSHEHREMLSQLNCPENIKLFRLHIVSVLQQLFMKRMSTKVVE